MYDVVIVEDEPEAAQILINQLQASPYADELSITHATSATALRELMDSEREIDILLMDIALGEGPNGIEVVSELLTPGSPTQVIYVTGYIEYCVQAYRTDHVFFLVKPVDQADLNEALKRALANVRSYQQRVLVVHNGSRVIGIPVHKIRYIESNLRKVAIYYGDESIETYATIRDLIHELPPAFVQCHKSFLVNMDYIAELLGEDILLTTGEKIPLVKRRRTAVRDAFVTHIQSAHATF